MYGYIKYWGDEALKQYHGVIRSNSSSKCCCCGEQSNFIYTGKNYCEECCEEIVFDTIRPGSLAEYVHSGDHRFSRCYLTYRQRVKLSLTDS